MLSINSRHDTATTILARPRQKHLGSSHAVPFCLGDTRRDIIDGPAGRAHDRRERAVRLDLDVVLVERLAQAEHVGCVEHVGVVLDLHVSQSQVLLSGMVRTSRDAKWD